LGTPLPFSNKYCTDLGGGLGSPRISWVATKALLGCILVLAHHKWLVGWLALLATSRHGWLLGLTCWLAGWLAGFTRHSGWLAGWLADVACH